MKIEIGTRGSRLALAQAEIVAQQLRNLGAEVSLQIIHTTGDTESSAPLGPPSSGIGIGVFVKEIEQALLSGEISLAVHSMKDLPIGVREGLEIAAVLERADPSDALVMRLGFGLSDLPSGARVGTGSPRRAAQLRAHRPDLVCVPVRGNVDTRLRKLEQGEFEALILASAGLIRLGMADDITQRLPFDICLPAPGQGALALQVRSEDAAICEFASRLDHLSSRAAVAAERAFLGGLGGGCTIPVGALGMVEGERVLLTGMVASKDGAGLLRDSAEGSAADAQDVGAALAERLLTAGARDMLNAEG